MRLKVLRSPAGIGFHRKSRMEIFIYLAELTIKNFCKQRYTTLKLQPGLDALVGPNNVGKSAVINALRTPLAGHEEPYPRLDIADRHRTLEGELGGNISFHWIVETDQVRLLGPASI